ncbi:MULTISPECIES: hypothetical protein [unclassified Lysobacter]|uniref:hypothetical protein n=1 Tax=unclassified Lysobacter TaxID=2635362 RepID=UPI001BE86A15|nr:MULTISPECIES: hypothetical protein [unclassified Lysobacter]MBT2745865.1 hypothetical protein [Lysobacter sp. ISL-42]MBT2749576.1 hypothetical protein [Lysobacter sp. ISL-50]MBT2778780.1 hypothetical protein [Lysobacter sp. ISL-54]MBT2781375.1 hypothetical protein [Lysobacter sp. ISL-52]
MKKIEFLVPVVLIYAALATGCGQKAGEATPDAAAPAVSAPAKASELNLFALDVGTSENPDGTVMPLTQFLPTEKIVASLRTRGAANAVPVTAKLIAMSNGEVVGELKKDLTLTGAATTNLGFVRQGAGNWALGRYVVEVTIDGKPAGRQEIEVTQTLPEGARPRAGAKA